MSGTNILIAPLEWGLGHSGRCVPLAIALQAKGHNIIVAAGEKHLIFLRQELPGATYLLFPGFNPTYSRIFPMWLVMALKSPLLIYHIINEHVRLKRIVKDYNIDVVISDNRFGLWNNTVKTIYITHQLRIRFPRWTVFFEPLGAAIHKWFINKYDYCLVPDLGGDVNLSGELSHQVATPRNVKYIGILSRFTSPVVSNYVQAGQFTLLLLSGPEPQRSIFREKMVSVFKTCNVRAVILGANPSENSDKVVDGNITYFSHLPSAIICELIVCSDKVITRSGYTTIMELVSLGKHAFLVPTPGQTEQEYLAGYLSEKGWFATINQADIDERCLADYHYLAFPEDFVRKSHELLMSFIDNYI